jgi:type VI secretion system secreted protein Hcp
MKKLLNLTAFNKWLTVTIVMVYLLPLLLMNGIAAGYLKIGDIKGESTDSAHQDWIELASISQGVTRPVSGAGSGGRISGPSNFKEVAVTKWIDKSTPILMESICQGRVYPKVEIDIVSSQAGSPNTNYLQYELKDVIVTSYQTGGSASGDPLPTEELSLNFTEIKVTYTQQENATGETIFSTNVSCVVEDRLP